MFIVKLLQHLDDWGHLYILHFVVACRRFISSCWNRKKLFAFTSSELETAVLLGSDSRMLLNIFQRFWYWFLVAGCNTAQRVSALFEDASNAKTIRAAVQVVISSCTLHYTKQLFISIRVSLRILFPMDTPLACKPWFRRALCVAFASAVRTPRELSLPFLWNAIRNGYVCVSAGSPSFQIAEEFSLIRSPPPFFSALENLYKIAKCLTLNQKAEKQRTAWKQWVGNLGSVLKED